MNLYSDAPYVGSWPLFSECKSPLRALRNHVYISRRGFAQENCLETPAISRLFSSPLVVLVVVRETAFAFNLYHCRENSRLRPNALSLDPPPRKVRGFAKSCVLGLQPRIEFWIRLELIEMFTLMQLSCFKDATTICRWNKVYTYHSNGRCVRVPRESHDILLRNETPRS